MPGRPYLPKGTEKLHGARARFSQAQIAPPKEELAKEKCQRHVPRELPCLHRFFTRYLFMSYIIPRFPDLSRRRFAPKGAAGASAIY
jgi:hypothetical protein